MDACTKTPRSSATRSVPPPTRVLGICGSLRSNSYNRKLLRAARALAPHSVELELWDGLKRVPPFSEDDEHLPGDAVVALREAIARADAVLIATPQYNASLPGQLKNALDWTSRPYETNVLRNKPVAVIGTSPGRSGAARAQAEARTVLAAIGAEVLDVDLAIPRAFEQFAGDGTLTSDVYRRRLAQILDQLVAQARRSDAFCSATQKRRPTECTRSFDSTHTELAPSKPPRARSRPSRRFTSVSRATPAAS